MAKKMIDSGNAGSHASDRQRAMAAQLALRRQVMEESEARELGLLYGCPDELMAMRRAAFNMPANAVSSVMQVSKRRSDIRRLLNSAHAPICVQCSQTKKTQRMLR